MSELILSKYPREILHSKCGIRNNEVEYIVNSAGVNVRSQPNLNDNSVIGVIQKGEIVCPYMYVNTSNRTVGRWMGFQLTNGNTAWVAESLLERYYYEPEPVAAEPVVLAADKGAKIYEANCKLCHEKGLLQAPKFGDKEDWAPRLAQGKETLYKHSAEGFKAMPPQAADGVTVEQVHAAVDYMIEQAS